MANHKSSKKRIRQTLTKRAHNRLYHKTARNAVKALRNTTEKSAAEALLPKVTAMLDKLAKHNIVHKNKAANLKSAIQLHVNALFAQNSKPPDEGGFFISSPHLTFRLTASGNTPPPRRSPAATPPLSDIPTYTVKKKPPAHLRTARSPTLSGNSRTVYSFSANPCARSRISDPSGVTR